jgi:hypothetical protein
MLDESSAIVKNSDVAGLCSSREGLKLQQCAKAVCSLHTSFPLKPPFLSTVELLRRGASMNPQSQLCKVCPPLFAAASHLTRFIIPHCDQKKLDMIKTNPNLVSESLRSVARAVLLAHVLTSVLCRQAFARYKRMLEQNDNKGLAVCTAASSFTWRCFTRAQDTSAACDAALSVLDATPSPSCKVGRTCAQSHPASCPPPPTPARLHTQFTLCRRDTGTLDLYAKRH